MIFELMTRKTRISSSFWCGQDAIKHSQDTRLHWTYPEDDSMQSGASQSKSIEMLFIHNDRRAWMSSSSHLEQLGGRIGASNSMAIT